MTQASLGAARTDPQILVAGAGATGIAAALALSRGGFRVVLAGRSPPPLPGRTVALFEGSLRFLAAVGALNKIKEKACPIEAIEMIDDTGQLLPTPDLKLRASEIGLKALGINISNDDLVAVLRDLIAERSDFEVVEGDIADYVFDGAGAVATFKDGRTITADFVVAADGKQSRARDMAGIDTREWSYPQVALTAVLAHEDPHRNVSVEHHTRSGPFTLVPLPPGPSAPHRSSLVWLMSLADAKRRLSRPREELAYELQDRSHGRFGAIRIESDIGQFRMGGLQVTRHAQGRIALVGETCHAFPPIGAQGLNLSLRDVADLEECLAGVDLRKARSLASALARYDRRRRADIGFRTLGVDILNRSLILPYLPVDLLRGASFIAMNALGPLRRAVIREGVTPHLLLPRLMRA
ncbi:MAG TPA: FAD-dependent monooxygenase [Methylocystis sp.]|nr:FAD-dependent monooxygenase [Methylocystis sp.]